MAKEYEVFDGERDPAVDPQIQREIQWMIGRVSKDVSQVEDMIFMADIGAYQDNRYNKARLLGYTPGSRRLHSITGLLYSHHHLVGPLEELEGSLFDERLNPTSVKMAMLKKLQEVVQGQSSLVTSS